MPPDIPKITGSEADRAEWLSMLVGKKIGKDNDATVCRFLLTIYCAITDENIYRPLQKKDLPGVRRILRPDDGYRLDYRSVCVSSFYLKERRWLTRSHDRLNAYLDEEDVVRNVRFF